MPDTRTAVPASRGRSRLVARGFQVLFEVAGRPDGATLGALSRATGLSRATTLRILRTLSDLEVLSLDPADHSYRLGPSAYRLGAGASTQTELVRLARAPLERLQADTGETACLFRRQGNERVCIAALTSEQELKYSIEVGHRRPLLRGAPGKVIAAYLSPDELERLGVGATERRALIEEGRRIRAAGVVASSDEVVRGGTAVAAPIFGPDALLVAILAVIGPTARLDRETVRRVLRLVKRGARTLTAAVGGAAPRLARPQGTSRG